MPDDLLRRFSTGRAVLGSPAARERGPQQWRHRVCWSNPINAHVVDGADKARVVLHDARLTAK
jgi:hypothetical protein